MTQDSDNQVVLFLDLLGFAALTEAHPYHVVEEIDEGWKIDRFGDAATQFGRFQWVLNQALSEEARFRGGLKAMIFSDCAFLLLGTSLSAALFATDLMRQCIMARIPVRMGLGLGTFNAIRFSADNAGATTVNRALFMGDVFRRWNVGIAGVKERDARHCRNHQKDDEEQQNPEQCFHCCEVVLRRAALAFSTFPATSASSFFAS